MTTYFISRHAGAKEWAAQQYLHVDRVVEHLDPAMIAAGDTVIGSLPVNLAAEVCMHGARYLHLSINLPANMRGKELAAADMAAFHARLEEFSVLRK